MQGVGGVDGAFVELDVNVGKTKKSVKKSVVALFYYHLREPYQSSETTS